MGDQYKISQSSILHPEKYNTRVRTLKMQQWRSTMIEACKLAVQGPVTGGNPQVGCIILDSTGCVISRGYHKGVGTPHAEIAALNAAPPERVQGSTVVVTLEPCNRWGRTGPCAQALIKARVGRIVYAASDPSAPINETKQVFKQAGIEVISGVALDHVKRFLSPWLIATQRRLPFVTVKWASSLDGRVAANDGSSMWITGPKARDDAHMHRTQHDCLLVGTGTILADNPRLTARTSTGELYPHQPVVGIIGKRALEPSLRIFSHPQKPLIFASHNIKTVLETLYKQGHRRVFLEAGPQLLNAFIRQGYADDYLIYMSPTLLGGQHNAISDIAVPTLQNKKELTLLSVKQLGNDIRVHARSTSTQKEQ